MERMWFIDSGCSRHMMSEISLFIDFTPKKKGFVIYKDNNKGATPGKGSVDDYSRFCWIIFLRSEDETFPNFTSFVKMSQRKLSSNNASIQSDHGVFVLNNGKENLGMFDAKPGKGIFLGYSQSNKAYRVYNKRLFTVKEFVHVTFDESYLRKIKKDISFHDASVSSEDILKDTEKGIDQPEAVRLEEEEDDNPEKDKDESRTKLSKLEEHEQEFNYLEKHKQKIKKENDREKYVETKSISLMGCISKSSTKDQDDGGKSDLDYWNDEETGLFVKQYHKFIKGNLVKQKNLINYRRKEKSLNNYENKK
ncbi:uncharacterized protein LOC127079674 [Lathyrus oleraceus]|uniref:uncharacterized protein LOC127079674 n=1 Tax=Pisum sativum TaxID=3888 RepID=UPI0021CE4005|nr:uncharacterized protein LOC127079674 [Pisum sativum]